VDDYRFMHYKTPISVPNNQKNLEKWWNKLQRVDDYRKAQHRFDSKSMPLEKILTKSHLLIPQNFLR
jgi:hypothetical protein